MDDLRTRARFLLAGLTVSLALSGWGCAAPPNRESVPADVGSGYVDPPFAGSDLTENFPLRSLARLLDEGVDSGGWQGTRVRHSGATAIECGRRSHREAQLFEIRHF